jgi:hypothetical protein
MTSVDCGIDLPLCAAIPKKFSTTKSKVSTSSTLSDFFGPRTFSFDFPENHNEKPFKRVELPNGSSFSTGNGFYKLQIFSSIFLILVQLSNPAISRFENPKNFTSPWANLASNFSKKQTLQIR